MEKQKCILLMISLLSIVWGVNKNYVSLIYKYGIANLFFVNFKSMHDEEFLGYFYCFS